MVSLLALWLPILVAAVIVFVASSVLHLMLPYHRGDCAKLPSEDIVMEAMRKAGVQHDDQEHVRRPDLRPAHRRHVRLAVAELTGVLPGAADLPPGLKPRGSTVAQ